MAENLSARGPDGTGLFAFGATALAHTRLAVVDTSDASVQPFGEGKARVVFSGALYNYRALRSKLESEGIAFRSKGDTEVVYRALCAWGEDALARFEGMFALAFFDTERDTLLLARDRVGIRSLLYAEEGGTILVSNEARPILRAMRRSPKLDALAWHAVRKYNHPLGTRTLFEGIELLAPGSFVIFHLAHGRKEQGRYAPRLTFAQCEAEGLRDAFDRSVSECVDVDGPLAAYVSSGIDSLGIFTAASKHRDVSALSLAFPGEPNDESAALAKEERRMHFTAEHLAVTSVSRDDYERYVARAEMPQLWTSDLALMKLSAFAHERGHRVALSGEGPDELFGGYDAYRYMAFRKTVARHANVFAPIARYAIPWMSFDRSLLDAYARTHSADRNDALRAHYGFYPEQLMSWEAIPEAALARSQRARLGEYTDYEAAYFQERYAGDVRGLSPLEQNLTFEVRERLPRWILHMGDRMAATSGMEIRYPYLHDGYVRAALAVPPWTRRLLLVDKWAHRWMHRRALPTSTLLRRKRPLHPPLYGWLGKLDFSDLWSQAQFEHVGLLDFSFCDAAKRRLESAQSEVDRLRDEWTWTFALSTQIFAKHLLGA